MVCPPSPRSCLLLSPIVPFVVSFCWLVCPPSRHLVSTCLPLYPFFLVPLCLPLPIVPGWCVCLSEGLVSLCLPLYPFLTPLVGRCVRLADGLVSPCLPLYPFLFPFVGRLPEGVSPLYPWLVPCGDGVSAFLTLLSPIVPLLVSLCWMVRPPS